jgi:Zn-dependent alcohol dehydrogenase
LRLDDVVSHLTALEGIEEAFERLRRGVGAHTVVVLDEALAGTTGEPFVA